MSVVRPFRGLRPKPKKAKDVAAPPYDVLSSDEARELVKNNPDSFLRVNKPEVDFDPSVDVYGREIYQRGKDNLERLVRDGIMIRDEKPSFYLYRLTMDGRVQTGLVALTSVDEYDRGLIKKHEHTRPKKVSDRADHIQTLGAQVGPVFSIFRNNETIAGLFKKATERDPELDFVSEYNVRHQLWVISDTEVIDEIVSAFGALGELYIADGHHRSAAASEVCRRLEEKNPNHTGNEHYNFFLNVIFPDNELHILPYNRVVVDLNSLSLDELLKRASEAFDIKTHKGPVESRQPYHMGLYAKRSWYEMVARENTFDRSHPVESIDSAILTKNLLDPVLGIKDIRTDERIDFVGGIRGVKELEKLVDSRKFEIAFSLYPVTVQQLLKVADAGEVMPPKSTWFEPKLRSGMVINLLDE
jgi:uncharacterized protein (DUF1015 family)